MLNFAILYATLVMDDATSGVVNLRKMMFTDARDSNFGLNLPLLSLNRNRKSSCDNV